MPRCVALIFFFLVFPAYADVIRVDMSGTITDPGNISTLAVGDTWSLNVYLDSEVADSDPAFWLGVYSTLYGELSIGPYNYQIFGLPSEIRIDLSGGTDFLSYGFSNVSPIPNTLEGYSFDKLFVTFQSEPGIFDDDALPNIWTVGIDDFIGSFPNRTRLSLNLRQFGQLNTNVLGEVNAYSTNVSPIPTPAAAWLFISALGLLGWARRKAA